MLEVKNVTKRYGKNVACNDVSFTLEPGTLTVLLGPNGAGKSTIIKSIIGFLKYQGEITVNGINNKTVEARKILYLPTYKWVLDNKAHCEVEFIRNLSLNHTVILLDYATNPDIEDASSPLSHAALIKAYVEGNYPSYEGIDTKYGETMKELMDSFHVGQEVKHSKFGKGIIESKEKDRVVVAFEEVGEKLLSLRFAKLESV